MEAVTRITLLGKPGCHLCDDARAAVERVIEGRPGVELVERSVLDDPVLFDRYAEEIPVVFIDDRVHTIWRVDEGRLGAALDARAPVARGVR